MKILKPGKMGTEGWKIEHLCTGFGNGHKGCQALLEVEYNDLRYYEGVAGESWGSRDPAICFKCPVCGSVTDIKESDYPFNTQDIIPWTMSWYKPSRSTDNGEK